MTQQAVRLGGREVVLRADRTVWWPEGRALFVADVHLGKATAFRRLGVPVPTGPTADTFERLAAAVEATAAHTLVILGDLLHARGSVRAPGLQDRWMAWRRDRPGLAVRLVLGNHDRRAGAPPPEWAVEVVDDGAVWQGWRLCHEPPRGGDRSHGAPVLCGHVHPGVRLSGRAGDRLTLPCFVCDDDRLLLPAFGAFTGLHTGPEAQGGRRFAVLPEGVVEVPAMRR